MDLILKRPGQKLGNKGDIIWLSRGSSWAKARDKDGQLKSVTRKYHIGEQ